MEADLSKALCDIYGADRGIITELQKRSVTVEKYLAQELVIPANTRNGSIGNRGYYETDPIENQGYCCGRLLLDVAFDISATAGLTVDMYYKSEKIGEVIKVASNLQVTGGSSPSLDLSNLSGFRFAIVNHDPVHDVTVKNLRMVMWGLR
jgi:hypothetical protein